MELAGKVVLVTGGANGIGRALCERFAAEGAAGIAVVDLVEEAARAVADGLGGVGLALAADVGVEAEVARAVQTAEATLGPIDLLVGNAGIGTNQGIGAPTEEWQRVWEVNVMAHVFAARAVLPGMVARRGGHLLLTASAAGLLSNIGDAAYTATKHAAVGLAEWLAITYGDDGIRVACLCPQGVNTDLLRTAAEGEAGAAVLAQGTLEPEDVAEAVVEGLRDERFLILPHPEVHDYEVGKATDRDRWLAGMRKLQRRVRAGRG